MQAASAEDETQRMIGSIWRGFRFWWFGERPGSDFRRSMRTRCWLLLSWSPVSRLSPAVHDRDDKDVISLD